MNILESFFSVMGLLNLALLLAMVVALVDAATRPAQAYLAASKQTKQVWLAILAIAVAVTWLFGGALSLFGLVGLVATIVYFVDVRPALRSVSGGGGGSTGSQGPYGPW